MSNARAGARGSSFYRSSRVAQEERHAALARDRKASASWKKLAPAVRRGYVKSVLDAKKQATRNRRVAKIVETLGGGVPARRTWKPANS
jgi:uncharacterized protein YdeI (YjbR/CyaY-like superfamily)